MKKLSHKIVCWGDYAIPVDEKYKWMSFDNDGAMWFSCVEPEAKADHPLEVWEAGGANMTDLDLEGNDIIPPEPGPWYEQLYNIE